MNYIIIVYHLIDLLVSFRPLLATMDIILAIIAVAGKHNFCHDIDAVAHLVY